MAATTFNITLPPELADAVEGKVASGAYASVGDVLRDGLRVLLDRDAALEYWLQTDVAAAYDDHVADPGSAIPGEQLMDRLRDRAAIRRRMPDGA